MAYVGNSPSQQTFTGGMDQFNGNASNTTFGLSRSINTAYDVDVYVESVFQRPGVAYTVSANTITFTSAPTAGSNNVVVVYNSYNSTSLIPADGSVNTRQLGTITNVNAGTNTDLTLQANNATSITVAANGNVGISNTTPADKLVVAGNAKLSLGSALYVENPAGGRLGAFGTNTTGTYVSSHNGFGEPLILNAPHSSAFMSMTVAGSEAIRVSNTGSVVKPLQPAFRASFTTGWTLQTTITKVSGVFTERFDITNSFDVATSKFTAPIAGRYLFMACWAPTSTGRMASVFYVNGSSAASCYNANGGASFNVILNLAANDYVELYAVSATGGTVGIDNSGEYSGYFLG